MGANLFEKIVARHLVKGEMVFGNEVAIRVDQVFTMDALGTMAYLQFEAMGIDAAKVPTVSYVDHNTMQDSFENADDHRYLQSIANKIGVKYSKPGNGVCHSVHLARFTVPGDVLIGGESHTPIQGALGALGIAAGGMDIAVSMGGGAYHFHYPQIIRVNLNGKLSAWCTAKDVVLEMLKLLTSKGNETTVIEYGGNGLPHLSITDRATICSMGTEMGVLSSIFPCDETARRYLQAQGRESAWQELFPDNDAEYARVIDLDLTAIQPNIACPHSPDNVKTVKEEEGKKVDQVLIGSCINGYYRDIMMAAAMLKGKRIHPEVSLGIAPATKQVMLMVVQNGALADLISAGARILEVTCGFCVGVGQAPHTNAVSLRTSCRNYLGRNGTKDSFTYLVSPETAVAAALTGKITDPRDLGLDYPSIAEPEAYDIDDSMIIQPTQDKFAPVFRGPNIGTPPKNEPLPKRLNGKVAIKLGDKVSTELIIPAGTYMKYRSNIPVYAEYVFHYLDSEFPERCKNYRNQGFSSIIVAGFSYGQGSSREHAALCPMSLGVKVVLAKSMERIHAANLVNFGILKLTFADVNDYDRIEADDELAIDDVWQCVKKGVVVVQNVTKKYEFAAICDLTPREKEIVLAGGMLQFTAKMLNEANMAHSANEII